MKYKPTGQWKIKLNEEFVNDLAEEFVLDQSSFYVKFCNWISEHATFDRT